MVDFTCTACPNRRFLTLAAYKQHCRDTGHQEDATENTRLDEDPITCAICFRRFGTLEAKNQHSRDTGHHVRVFTPPPDQPDRCPRCPNREFVDTHALEQHQQATGHGFSSTSSSSGASSSGSETTIQDPIDRFFTNYPSFAYDPTKPYNEQFEALAAHRRWSNSTYKNVRDKFKQAMGEAFEYDFGSQDTDYNAWVRLCNAMGIEPAPPSITQCKKAIKNINVNLVDMHTVYRSRKLKGNQKPVHQLLTFYPTQRDLSNYIRENKKRRTFPKDQAKEGGLLKYLLRHVF